MLSIQAMTGGQGTYYLDLAREDYYLGGGEPPGLWWGRGAHALKLAGHVERLELQRLLEGFSVDGEKLTQNAGRENRRPGWDMTFSAPKSVSVLWSQTDSKTRLAIQAAHLDAVKTALQYLENEAAFSRRGKGGHTLEHVGMCVALFEHGTSRAGDPNLHTHALGMNVGIRPDGTAGTVVSHAFYRLKMTLGAIYRAQMSFNLHNLGFRCERKRTWFEIAGVPKQFCEFFSKRRQQIEDLLGKLGLETASAAAFATLETRKVKAIVPPREELFRKWQNEGCPHEFRGRDWSTLKSDRAPVNHAKAYKRVLAEAVAIITSDQSHFSEGELLRRAMEASQGQGISATFVQGWLKHDLQTGDQFVRLGERNGEVRYTTKEILKAEERLYQLANDLRTRGGLQVGARYVDDLAGLRRDQRRAVEHLTDRPGGLAILAGMAGTGKTTTLEACRKRWEAAGLSVVGAALAGKAARQLQAGSGIQSYTLESLQLRMYPSLSFKMEHHAKQLWRAALGKPTWKLSSVKIDHKTVLVVDEAGMIGTGQMAKILETVARQGGKVVLVGDARQLQPIDSGGPFAALGQRHGFAELTQISRQRDEKDRQLVRDMASGQGGSALKSLDERGLVLNTKTRAEAMGELVSSWSREIGSEPSKSQIFCSTNEEAQELNRRCQAQQSLRHRIDTSRSLEIHEGRAYVGDRVLFTQNSSKLGVSNGETGTVVKIDRFRGSMTVQIDGGEAVRVTPRKYTRRDDGHRGECGLRLGYAVTTHKGQGSTVDYAYVLAGGPMQDREISYVQLSRARRQTRVFTDQHTAGAKLEHLSRDMDQIRQKDMAHDVMREDREHRLRLTLQQHRAATA